MPLTKRAVSPVDVSLHRLPASVHRDELECVANGTLANLVRQLSSLSRHAEDLFGELYHEAVKLDHKTNTLAARVDRLTHKVTQLDSNDEEVMLQDLHLRKPFKSSSLIDQHTLDRQTLPTAMNECYGACDRPPELDKLNPFRDDKKTALRYYTDPSYFFDLWKQEMLKDMETSSKRAKNAKNRSPTDNQGRKKRLRQPADHRQKYFEKALRTGEMIDLPAEYQAPELLRAHGRPPSQPPPGMVRPQTNGYQSNGQMAQYQHPATVGHPNQAIYDQHQQQQLPRVSLQATGLQQQYQPSAVGRPVTSQYMAAGYGLTLPRGDLTPSDHSGTVQMHSSPTSIDSASQRTSALSGSSPYRPNQAPPAPPIAEGTNGHLNHRFNQMGLQQTSTPVRPAPSHPDRLRGLSPLPAIDDELDMLPPPPPPLSPDQLARMQSSVVSMTADKLPSPPPMHVVPTGASMPPPPPPPPPPPMSHMNGLVVGSFGGGGGDRQRSASPPKQPRETSGGETMSNLLLEIQTGIKLKKVQRQEERAEERAATEGNDVAAILRRRMEHVLGGSDSNSDDDEFGEDEWDD